MKVAFIAPFGIRPKGTLIARMVPLAAALQSLGHQTVVIAPPYTNPEDSGKVETVRGVTIRNISLPTATGAAAAPIIGWRLFNAALEERSDLVHLFKPKGYGGLSAMLHLFLQNLGTHLPPLFIDTDDWEGKGGMNSLRRYSPAERMVFRLQEQWLPPRAAGVTVASRTLQTMVWGMGVPAERVLYLPNCVEDAPQGDGAAVRERFGIPHAAPVVLLYTRFFEFSQDKLHFLFDEICRQVPEVRFLVVGRGQGGEEDRLLAVSRERGLHRSLAMAGWVEPSELPDYLAAGDAAIYPFADTLVNRAKCPAKLTELLRAGVPVVADEVGQIAEYVGPGAGFLCRSDNWGEMVERTVELLRDPAKRREIGSAGRRHVLEQFNWRGFAEKLALFYANLLRQKQS